MQLIDEVKINIKSGNGGNGCRSFRREKFIPYGGPNGGNGGNGGDVIIKSDQNISSLISYRYKHHFKAESGKHGSGNNKTGSSGENLILYVPVGTQLISDQGNLIFDFIKNDQEYLLLEGGQGGLGNAHFKTSVNQAPQYAQTGQKGDEIWIWLKLKMFSDCGIIGFPNSGKSTFISKVTNARPKIASYPFSTLSPKLGVAELNGQEVLLSDIPGLIEGAHKGIGLGTKFLKHIERCKIILHLIDITSSDIIDNYRKIRSELLNFSKSLTEKKEIICLTKSDLVDDEYANTLKEIFKEETKLTPIIISSELNLNIKKTLNKIFKEINLLENKNNIS